MKSIEDWTFLETSKKARMEDYAFHFLDLLPGTKTPGKGMEDPEPPPPNEVRRLLAEHMRDVGRGLMISGMKPARQQMLEIGRALEGLLEHLSLLADQPGREALRRRILLNLRPRVMSGK